MIPPVRPNNRKFERFEVNMPAHAVGESGEHDGILKDISEGGAAITVSSDQAALFSNQEFVELQVAGYEHLKGRVVRDIPDGYALEFETSPEERRRMADAIKKFEAVVNRKRPLEA